MPRYLPLERAAERGGDRDRECDPVARGALAHPCDDADRLGDRHPQVSLAERLGRDHHRVELADAGGERAVVAALVQRERRVDDAVVRGQSRRDGLGVGELRDALRMDERRHLDASCARGDGALDQRDLLGRRERLRLVLQAVARRDLDDLDAAHRRRA
jgi:hypothetical protein